MTEKPKILKVKGETRAGEVLQKMRLDIINCALKPGEKLRFETLRGLYSVSFSTLREALSRLSAEGLVASQGQRGFIVSPVSISELKDLTDVRVLLEREALRLSMLNGDDQWEADIIGTFHRMDKLQNRLGSKYYLSEDWAEIHGEFHYALIASCQSPNLIDLRQKLHERAHRYRRMSSKFRPNWREKDVEHKAIMDAVLERKEKEALRFIEQHIRETTKNVIEHAGHLFPEEQSVPDFSGNGNKKIIAA